MVLDFTRYTSEFKNNLKLATPIMLGSLGHMLVGLIDDIMVGRLGPIELAATSLGNSVIFIAISIGFGFSLAITPLIAESDGSGDTNKSRSIFQHGMILTTILGVTMAVVLLLIKPVFYYLDQPPEVVVLAIPYYELVAVSMIPMMIFQGFKQFTDGLSQTKYAMYATILSNIVNIVLNFVLIYGLWIFPRLEIVGAALGTLVSRFVLVGFMYYILSRNAKFQHYMKRLQWSEVKKVIFRKIINLGFPTALQMLFEVGLFTSAILLAGTLGAYEQAANQIALKLSSTTFMIAVGIGVAATIRVGNQKGLKNYLELRRLAFSNFFLILILMCAFSLAFIVFKDLLPYIFTDNKEVATMASGLLVVAAMFQLSDGLQAGILGGLRGLQDMKIPSLLSFVSYWMIGFPISWYLGTRTPLGPQGIWIGLLVALFCSALFLFLRFNYLSKKLIREKNELT